MVNTRKKGNRIERKAEDRLKEDNFVTSRMPHTRFGDSDHYNLYDIIAAKPGAPFKCIQVKANAFPNHQNFKEKSLETVPTKHCDVEMWKWVDYQGWHIKKLDTQKKEWKTVVDQT